MSFTGILQFLLLKQNKAALISLGESDEESMCYVPRNEINAQKDRFLGSTGLLNLNLEFSWDSNWHLRVIPSVWNS